MKKHISLLIALILLSCIFIGCAASDVSDDGCLSVVTVSFPPYDFARAILGESGSVSMLLAPGAEMHSYDPTPQDIRKIQNCDIFIYGGGVSDAWIDTILDSIDAESVCILSMTELVSLLPEETKDGMTLEVHDHEEHDHEEHDHTEDEPYDEHVWTSPANAAAIVAAIRDAACTLDEANADSYRANADAYIEEIEALSAEFTAVCADAKRNTVIFADRFPFLYFVREFSLNYFAAFPGCAEQTEPGAQTIAFLIRKVSDENIPAVFYTEFSNQQLADSICEATGTQKLLFHSCHNVSKSDFDKGVTYVSLMRQNLENLRKALN